jgi:5-methylcytosine-specific restriction endonuclease McrA
MPIDMAAYMRSRRATRRADLINLAGGVCFRCGTDEDLQFDHRDPATKSFVLSGKALDKAWVKILEEFEKCDLLCRPCHLIKSVENGETGGGWNKVTEHGTEAMHRQHDARVARGDLTGSRGLRH